MDHQLGAASEQIVDHGGQALHDHLGPLVGFCFLESNIVMLLFYIFSSLLALTDVFSLIFFPSLSVIFCVLLFIESFVVVVVLVVVVSLVNEWKED